MAPLVLQAAQRYQEQGCLDAAALPQPEEAAVGGAAADAATLFRCRKCRALVATAHNVVEVEQVCMLWGGTSEVVHYWGD